MRGVSPDEQRGLLLSVGSHRAERPLSPVEVGELFNKARNAGMSMQECAEAVHLEGTSMVARFLRLLVLSPAIRHVVDWGQSGSAIAFTAAHELARLPPADQEAALPAILADQLTTQEVRQLVQLRLRSGRPIGDCVADIVRLRPQVERRYVFIGAVTDEPTRTRLASWTQAERDRCFGDILREQYPGSAALSGRLGVDRFTVVGGKEVASILSGATDMQERVNTALRTLGAP